MAGVRVHRPGAIATYMVLGGAIGIFLYGENLARRGYTLQSRLYRGGAVVLLLVVSVAAAAGQRVGGLGVPLLLFAIWIYKKEDDAFRRDLARGARPTKWWPPLLVLILVIILVLVAQAVFFPEVWRASPAEG